MSVNRHTDVHEAFRQLVMTYGVDEMAIKLGVPTGTLYNKINPNETSHHKATLADVVTATVISDDRRVLHAFARLMMEVCYRLPDMSTIETEALMDHLMNVNIEGGDFFEAIQNSLKGDRRITAGELPVIEKQAHEFVASILEALQRVKEMASK